MGRIKKKYETRIKAEKRIMNKNCRILEIILRESMRIC